MLKVFCGPMCAAKTTGALHAARRYARHGKRVVLIRPAGSRRAHEGDPEALSTKNGESFPSFDVERVEDIFERSRGADVVWLDEPNHFRHESRLLHIIPEIRRSSIILVSGLGATSELEPFGSSMPFFLATADDVQWRSADCDLCQTHGTATRSLYIGEAPKSGQLKAGGAESYRPVCPKCWTSATALSPSERWAVFAAS